MRLTALATYIPEGRIDAEEIIRDAGGSPSEARVFERLFGLAQVSSCSTKETRYDQFARILEELLSGIPEGRRNMASKIL